MAMEKALSRICSPGIIILALLVRLLAFPSTAQAQWRSQSDKLPGMDIDIGKLVLIAAGVTAVVVVTILVIKSGHKGEIQEDTLKTDSTSKNSSLWNYKNIDNLRVKFVAQQTAVVENKVPVTILYDTRRRAFSVGVSLKF